MLYFILRIIFKNTICGQSSTSVGSQPFGTHEPPNQNCTSLHTQKSELSPLCKPLDQKFYPHELLLSAINFFYSL